MTRQLRILLGLAIGFSIVHYTDNVLAYEIYPEGSLLGITITRDLVWISWIVFVAAGLAGYALYTRGRYLLAGLLLALFSTSGLVSLGHYTVPGMSEVAWWRHVSIWIDITLGAAVLAFAMRTVAVVPRPARP